MVERTIPVGIAICITLFHEDMRSGSMDDAVVYFIIAVLVFIIGLLAGYLVMNDYYIRRFLVVAAECEKAESIAPIITEMDRES